MLLNHIPYKPILRHLITGWLFAVVLSVLFIHQADLAHAHTASALLGFYDLMRWLGVGVVVLLFCSTTRFRFFPVDFGVLAFGGWEVVTGAPLSGSVVLLSGFCYFFIRLMLQSVKQAYPVPVYLLILVGVVEMVTGFLQLYGFTESNHSMYRLTGSFFNPGPYSGFLAALLPLALYWLLKKYPVVSEFSFGKWREIIRLPEQIADILLSGLATVYVAGVIVILPAGMSRSAWVAGVAGCLVVLGKHYRIAGFCRHYYRAHRRRVVVYGILALVLAGGAGTGMYLMKKGSADGRMLMWKISMRVIREHPWTGVGTGRFAGAFGQAQAEYFASGEASAEEERVAGNPEYGFNEYLQIGVEHGVIGLFLFLSVVGAALWGAAKSKMEGSDGVIGALTAMLVFACFSYPFRVLPMCVVFVMLLAMCGEAGAKQEKGEEGKRGGKWATLGFALCLSGLTFFLTREKEEKREAYVKWAEEKGYFNMNVFEGTVDHYRELYPSLKDQATFLFEYGQCLAKTGQYEESNRILYEGTRRSADPMLYNIIGKNYQALKQYDNAEEAFRHASLMVPHRLYPLYLMAMMYFGSGQTEKGTEMAKRVIAKEPKVMSTAVEEMKQECRQSLKMKNEE